MPPSPRALKSPSRTRASARFSPYPLGERSRASQTPSDCFSRQSLSSNTHSEDEYHNGGVQVELISAKSSLNISLDQNSSRCFKSFIPCQDSITAEYFGSVEALDDFENLVVKKNWKRLGTSAAGHLCLLDALKKSLHSLHPGQALDIPSVSELLEIRNSQAYRDLVVAKYAYDPQSVQDTFFSNSNMHDDVALPLLELLGNRNQERYALGVCITLCENPPRYSLHLLRGPSTSQPTEIVWLHNDNAQNLTRIDQPLVSGNSSCPELQVMNHWSGFGPLNPPYPNGHLTISTSLNLGGTSNTQLQEVFGPFEPHPDQAVDSVKCEVLEDRKGTFQVDLPEISKPKRPRARQTLYHGGKPIGPIKNAPPANTMLPFHLMSGITSKELLTFYPNHVLLWPAITTRVLADFGTMAAITTHVNFHWPPEQPEEALLANTLRYHIKRLCLEFIGGVTDDSDWKGAVKSRAKRDLFRDTPWLPSGQRNLKQLDPACTLYEVGEPFAGWQEMPSSGLFRDMVSEAMRNSPYQLQDSKPCEGSFLDAANPPSLPRDWLPHFESSNERERLGILQQRQSQERVKRTARKAMLDPQEAKECTIDRIDEDVQGNPDAIISRHFDRIAGEILLWLLDRNGGNLTQGQLLDKISAEIKRRNEAAALGGSAVRMNLIERSTLAYRKRAALNARAKKEGTTYENKYDEFEECKAGALKKRKLPGARTNASLEDVPNSKRIKSQSRTPEQDSQFAPPHTISRVGVTRELVPRESLYPDLFSQSQGSYYFGDPFASAWSSYRPSTVVDPVGQNIGESRNPMWPTTSSSAGNYDSAFGPFHNSTQSGFGTVMPPPGPSDGSWQHMQPLSAPDPEGSGKATPDDFGDMASRIGEYLRNDTSGTERALSRTSSQLPQHSLQVAPEYAEDPYMRHDEKSRTQQLMGSDPYVGSDSQHSSSMTPMEQPQHTDTRSMSDETLSTSEPRAPSYLLPGQLPVAGNYFCPNNNGFCSESNPAESWEQPR